MGFLGKVGFLGLFFVIFYLYILPELNFDMIYGAFIGIGCTLGLEIMIGLMFFLKSINKGRENKNIKLSTGGVTKEEREIL
jgi:hypothetical protein